MTLYTHILYQVSVRKKDIFLTTMSLYTQEVGTDTIIIYCIKFPQILQCPLISLNPGTN